MANKDNNLLSFYEEPATIANILVALLAGYLEPDTTPWALGINIKKHIDNNDDFFDKFPQEINSFTEIERASLIEVIIKALDTMEIETLSINKIRLGDN